MPTKANPNGPEFFTLEELRKKALEADPSYKDKPIEELDEYAKAGYIACRGGFVWYSEWNGYSD